MAFPSIEFITAPCQHCGRLIGNHTHANTPIETPEGLKWWHKSCERWGEEATAQAYAHALAEYRASPAALAVWQLWQHEQGKAAVLRAEGSETFCVGVFQRVCPFSFHNHRQYSFTTYSLKKLGE